MENAFFYLNSPSNGMRHSSSQQKPKAWSSLLKIHALEDISNTTNNNNTISQGSLVAKRLLNKRKSSVDLIDSPSSIASSPAKSVCSLSAPPLYVEIPNGNKMSDLSVAANVNSNLCFNLTSYIEQQRVDQENMIDSCINSRVKRLRINSPVVISSPQQQPVTGNKASFSACFSLTTKCITESILTKLDTNVNTELNKLVEIESPLDDSERKQVKSNTGSSSISSSTRRCLFKSGSCLDTSLSSTKKLLSFDSPCAVMTNPVEHTTTPTKAKCKQVTPVSYLKSNIIFNEEDEENNTSLTDYSLQSIEKSLSIRTTSTTSFNQEVIDQEELKKQHELIMNLLEKEVVTSHQLNTETSVSKLIGDRSRHHILPCTSTNLKHSDLNCISPETVTEVLQGRYDSMIDRCIIVDSRYPYEFEGGHIQNAWNIYTKDKLIETFLNERDKILNSEKENYRLVIIFHCEFSSERGPSLLRFLRNQDRAANRDAYPKLFYPELYLLEGGYKAFYEKHADFCEPKTYKPMLHVDHMDDLKHFRAKTKTWEAQHKHSSVTGTAHKSLSKNPLSRIAINGGASRLQRCPRSTLF